ncbi:MAG: hypothetical protein A3G87_03645 [Omnitrophica bacterium RIFCSPLOWO2_12_FULL_50_11]|nr:MAG: hypothetical protein A3G87_03645 [Omnitrophica bacterium RIFCSPLOWO2_12_FULL_50_11]
MSDQQFLDAVAVAIITPGPVVITTGFIGYLVAGFAGAVLVLAKRSIIDVITALIALISYVILLKTKKIPEPVLILFAAACGLVLYRFR